MSAPSSRSWAVRFGFALLVVGLLLIAFSLFEPYTYNKTLTDMGFMLLGLSVQMLGLALVIIGKK